MKGLIFDLDSTLIESKSARLTDEVNAWLVRADRILRWSSLSNNKNTVYLEKVKTLLDMPVIGYAKKPSRRGFRQAMEMLEMSPEQVAVVGDRPLTDILGGKRSGAKTVLVKNTAHHQRTILENQHQKSGTKTDRQVINSLQSLQFDPIGLA